MTYFRIAKRGVAAVSLGATVFLLSSNPESIRALFDLIFGFDESLTYALQWGLLVALGYSAFALAVLPDQRKVYVSAVIPVALWLGLLIGAYVETRFTGSVCLVSSLEATILSGASIARTAGIGTLIGWLVIEPPPQSVDEA